MAITESTLLAGCRPKYTINKASVTTEGAGTWHSLWAVAGYPIAGSTPPAFNTSAYIPTRATSGSFGQVNAAGGNELLMVALDASATVAGQLTIYDRIWACSGFSTNGGTGAQNITNFVALTTGRLRDGVSDYGDIEPWIEVYTAPGATAATWTVVGTDGGGTSRSYTYAHPANAETIGQMAPLVPPAAAVPGIQTLTSFATSANTGTAGSIGITLMRRLATLDLALINTGQFRGALDLALSEVKTDACLAMMIQCTAATSGVIMGGLGLSEVTP
jgi:hypothetical protein